MEVDIQFLGLTNNSSALLGTSDKVLAIFSVTNRAAYPVKDFGFYYIATSTNFVTEYRTYSPLGSAGTIAPHGSGTILTRVPTNSVPWRVVVPFLKGTMENTVLNEIYNARDRKSGRASFDFERFGRGAPVSDWVRISTNNYPVRAE